MVQSSPFQIFVGGPDFPSRFLGKPITDSNKLCVNVPGVQEDRITNILANYSDNILTRCIA